jgi:hypothetical protein
MIKVDLTRLIVYFYHSVQINILYLSKLVVKVVSYLVN